MEAPPRDPLTPGLLFAAGWLAQLAVALSLPLFADEAYYLSWARRPALGYLDHPPAVAWWVSLGHPRAAALALLPGGWWLLADAARRWGVERWRWLPVLLMWTPLGMAGFVATPDGPLLLGWCVALWGVAASRGLAVGLGFALCLWAKPTALVALPGLVWVLRGRAVGPLVLALALYAPHMWWSARHGWLPFSFQAAHRSVSGFHLHEALGAQVAVVSPVVFGLAVMAWRRVDDHVGRVLRALSLPVLLVWLAASLVTRVEANWPALAWPAAAVLVLRGPWRLNWALAAGGLLCAVGVGVAHVRSTRGRARLRPPFALPPVAARYQEKALLDLEGGPVPYLRAAGHRVCEYDRIATPPAPACGFTYLAGAESLAGRCLGTVVEVGAGRAECRCEGE